MAASDPSRLFFDRATIEARAFWTKSLRGVGDAANPLLDGGHGRAEPAARRRREWALGGDAWSRLTRLANQQPALVYAVAIAGLGIVFHRLTGARAIPICSPARGDDAPPNLVPIVLEIDPAATFRSLLIAVRETLANVYRWPSYSFESIARDVAGETGERCGLFDILVSLDGFHAAAPEAAHDLRVELDAGASLVARIDYAPDLIHDATVDRLCHALTCVLDAAVADTNRRIGDLPLTDADERARLTAWSAGPRADVAADVVQMFEAHVARRPDAPAVEIDRRALTYRDLDTRINALAHRLRAAGVTSESVVGVLLRPCFARIISTLAILKAEGVVLPLDPDHPRDRLTRTLADAHARVLITDPDREIVGPPKILALDDEAAALAGRVAGPVERTMDLDRLAYVIYTSGSTGRPKGVACHHRGLANLALAQMRMFRVTSSSRVVQFASPAFDASVSEIVMTLCAGATLVLGRRDALLPGEPLHEFLASERVTHATLMPSVLGLMPDAPLPDLETLIVAGEPCTDALVERWAPGRLFINAYGPTEDGVCSTLGACVPGEPVTIGRPMTNADVYVLDHTLAPVPVGAVGELCVGGAGVARGYVDHPSATAEKFAPDPFSGAPGARMYRTGDRARVLPDGRIDFVGRTDTQVKVRGFRIELGEIEHALVDAGLVREAAVLCRADRDGDKRLVAYISIANDATSIDDVRRSAAGRLPAYMIPDLFVTLPSLPKTSPCCWTRISSTAATIVCGSARQRTFLI